MTRLPTRVVACAAGLALAAGGLLTLAEAPGQAVAGAHVYSGTGFGPIPDGVSATCTVPGAARDVTYQVTGLVGRLTDVRVTGLTFNPVHPWVGDLSVTLIAPDGHSHVLFSRTRLNNSTGVTDSSNVNGPYTFADDAPGDWWSAASVQLDAGFIPVGAYRTSQAGGPGVPDPAPPTVMTASFAGLLDADGTWTLRFVDSCQGDEGAVTAATLELATTGVPDCSVQQAAVAGGAAAASSADQAASAAAAAVGKAQKAVKKAAKKLEKARSTGSHTAVVKAKTKLKKAKARLQQARTDQAAAAQKATLAHQQLAAAQAALTACQQA